MGRKHARSARRSFCLLGVRVRVRVVGVVEVSDDMVQVDASEVVAGL